MKAEQSNTLVAEFVTQFYLSSNIYSNLSLTEFAGRCGHKLRRRQEHGGDYLSNSHILEQQYAADG